MTSNAPLFLIEQMLILAIDTSARHGSVALVRGDANNFETLQLTPLEGGTYSARLIPNIDEILRAHKFTPSAPDGFAFVSGPGSFTGLRVGLATVKGLCEVLHKPLVAVSMLEAIAITHGDKGKSTAVLDAGRAEVYVGEYELTNNRATQLREYIIKLGEFGVGGYSSHALLTPDKSVADFLQQKGAAIRQVAPVQADGIGRIGIRKLLADKLADHVTIDANYIRRSDAEIFSTPKR